MLMFVPHHKLYVALILCSETLMQLYHVTDALLKSHNYSTKLLLEFNLFFTKFVLLLRFFLCTQEVAVLFWPDRVLSFSDTDIFGKPPCYEEAVLMEDPPPPYSEVLADPRGGTFMKPATLRAMRPPPSRREYQDPAPVFTSETSKPPVMAVFPERGYSSLIRLPSSQRWDSLGHLLSNMDLNHNNITPPGASIQAATAMATMPRREPRTQHHGLQGLQGGIPGIRGRTQGSHGGINALQGGLQGLQGVHGLRGLEPSCVLPTAFPLLGRSTAV